MDKKDGYMQFFERLVKKNDFFNFGLENIIFIKKEVVSLEWKQLLNAINNKSKGLYIRKCGKKWEWK